MQKSLVRKRCENSIGDFLVLLLCFVPTTNGLIQRNLTYEERKSLIIRYRIIPEIIKKVPKYHLQIEYLRDYIPNYGNRLDAHELEHVPYIIDWPCGFRKYHTLIMIDPDVPSARNPSKRAHLLWLVGNIKATFIPIAQEIANYMRPDPEEETGIHRVVFVVLNQPSGIIRFNETNYDDIRDLDRRYNFSVENFSKKYNLGDPQAVNFFITRWKFVPSTTEPWDPEKIVDQADGPWDPE